MVTLLRCWLRVRAPLAQLKVVDSIRCLAWLPSNMPNNEYHHRMDIFSGRSSSGRTAEYPSPFTCLVSSPGRRWMVIWISLRRFDSCKPHLQCRAGWRGLPPAAERHPEGVEPSNWLRAWLAPLAANPPTQVLPGILSLVRGDGKPIAPHAVHIHGDWVVVYGG